MFDLPAAGLSLKCLKKNMDENVPAVRPSSFRTPSVGFINFFKSCVQSQRCDSVSIPPHRDTFLRSLAATQWEKKRRSKHLSQSRLSSSDDVISGPQPVEESGGGELPACGKSVISK